jgi:uncharacterized coiled-coil protein SlyX
MENVENLLLEHLKRFQVTLERIEGNQSEMLRRMANLESGQASVIQHIGHLASVDAQLQLSMDRMTNRIERVERRLELTNAP